MLYKEIRNTHPDLDKILLFQNLHTGCYSTASDLSGIIEDNIAETNIVT